MHPGQTRWIGFETLLCILFFLLLLLFFCRDITAICLGMAYLQDPLVFLL